MRICVSAYLPYDVAKRACSNLQGGGRARGTEYQRTAAAAYARDRRPEGARRRHARSSLSEVCMLTLHRPELAPPDQVQTRKQSFSDLGPRSALWSAHDRPLRRNAIAGTGAVCVFFTRLLLKIHRRGAQPQPTDTSHQIPRRPLCRRTAPLPGC